MDWTYIDEGGNVQNFLSMIRYHIKFQNDDPANDNIATSLRWGNDASNYWYQSTYPTHYGTSWNKTVIDPSETSFITEVGSVDYSVIDWFQLVITLNAGASGEIFIDGLAFFFKEVDVWRRDETSIQLHGLKEVKFQDRRITDWKTGQDIADNILELLKYPAVNGSTTIPYYDPDLKLNMLVEPKIEGVKWPLYINGLSVTWTGDHVSTSITAGRPVPDEEDIEISLKLLRDQDSEKGTGFESASTYYQTTCFKDKELYCRTDCMGTNCQNAAQLLSCFTFAERNPCTTTCQRYKERTGWLNRILNQ